MDEPKSPSPQAPSTTPDDPQPVASGTFRVAAGREFWFDAAAADRAVAFFEKYLKHVEGEKAGQAFLLEPWQRDEVIRPLFGWKRPDGTRRYRVAWVEIPRKNGKSALASGLALYLLMADGEPGAQVFSAAGDREQAAIVFSAAKGMVEASPALSKRCEPYKRSILYRANGSVYRVLSADAKLKHGLNAHGVVFDEVHVQRDRELWDVLKTSTGARRQPLIAALTTAGFDETSICWELHEYAVGVKKFEASGGAEGIDDPSWLVVIYGSAKEENWKDPAVWKKANPNLGVSIKTEYLAEQARQAEMSPAYENTFRNLHLNQWTSQATRWMPMDRWDDTAGLVDADDLLGLPCYAGLDLSSTRDLTALVLVFPIAGSDGAVDYKVVPYFWVPAENLARRAREDGAPYVQWVKAGLIETTEGNVVDYGAILNRLDSVTEKFQLKELAYDRWGSQKLVTDFQARDIVVVPFGQGFASMSAPMKEMLTLTYAKRFHHGGHPVLRWMAEHVVARQDPAGNVKPDKAKSRKRIDGVVAAMMGLDRALRNQVAGSSVYDQRGIRTL